MLPSLKSTLFGIYILLILSSNTCTHRDIGFVVANGTISPFQRKIDSFLKKLEPFLSNLQNDFFSKKSNLSIENFKIFHDISDKQRKYIEKIFKRTYPLRLKQKKTANQTLKNHYASYENKKYIRNTYDNTVHRYQNNEKKLDNTVLPKQKIPDFTKGIFLQNKIVQNKEKLQSYIDISKKIGINTFVIDIQPRDIPKEHIQMIQDANIFTVARLVVFQGGLQKETPSLEYIQSLLAQIPKAKRKGFSEIQLDYIRYADYESMNNIPLDFKYQTIKEFLQKAYTICVQENIYLSADVFGRITINYHDKIGQKLEVFSPYMDTIYPMLYPSHYSNDPNRINNPYETVLEGINKAKKRIPNNRIVAYIQGFRMKIKNSGLSYQKYIEEQIRSATDSIGDGYVIWNQNGKYEVAFQAIQSIREKEKFTKKN